MLCAAARLQSLLDLSAVHVNRDCSHEIQSQEPATPGKIVTTKGPGGQQKRSLRFAIGAWSVPPSIKPGGSQPGGMASLRSIPSAAVFFHQDGVRLARPVHTVDQDLLDIGRATGSGDDYQGAPGTGLARKVRHRQLGQNFIE